MEEHRSTRPPEAARQGPAAGEAVGLAPRLRASWQRSRRYGVTPEEMRPVFTGSVDTDSLLYECGHEVLRGLQATLSEEPVSMMITGSDGLVLCRLCDDTSINRSLDRVHLAPGFYFAESNAGTNGLGLALADRAPSLVRAGEHYCTDLKGYTCAAVPVLDPVTGELAGSVNLTTWSDSSPNLLLALAQDAASNTSALMLTRGTGQRARPAPRGEVFQVYASRTEGVHKSPSLSVRWTDAVAEARTAMVRGQALAVVGEAGAGKAALASAARREVRRRERVLCARPPGPEDIDAWLTLWAPELAKDDTCVIVAGVDRLPAWAAEELARLFTASLRTGREAGGLQPFVVTAEEYAAVPEPLRCLVGAVAEAPPLRFRPDDVLPLAGHFARQHRGRTVSFSPAASRALTDHHWPGNVRQLRSVVRDATSRTDVVDVRHLPAEVFTGSGRQLGRMQALERDEIVRCLSEPSTTVAQAADSLGMSRATVYRKMVQYNIKMPGRTHRTRN